MFVTHPARFWWCPAAPVISAVLLIAALVIISFRSRCAPGLSSRVLSFLGPSLKGSDSLVRWDPFWHLSVFLVLLAASDQILSKTTFCLFCVFNPNHLLWFISVIRLYIFNKAVGEET